MKQFENNIEAFGQTDVGMMRTINQDSIFLSTEPIGKLPNLFIVADGMGGHKAGDVASKAAIEKFVKYACSTHMIDPTNILNAGIQNINEEIFEMAESNKDYHGMGTTFVACVILGKKAYIANVGDSRLYVINRNIEQITKAIGVQGSGSSAPDIFEVEIIPGDILLLCSDGLTNMVTDEEIRDIVKENDSLELAVSKLIAQANENGGKDNISVIIIEPFSDEVRG